jgi:anti-anti-sigma regulatory factor
VVSIETTPVASSLATQLLGLPPTNVSARGAHLALDLAEATSLPANVVAAMRQGETGVEALRIGDTDYLFAYAPVATVGWSLGIITALTNLSANNGSTLVSELIGGVQRHRARVAVLDATGVVSIDTTTVQRIVEAVQTARLLGTEVLLAGITPAVAQMILALGVDLQHIRAFADLRAALQAAAFTA